jgi:Polyketide cyclase / dehydrase and lipid transport
VAVIRVDIEIAASPLAVWADVARIASHVEWMTDAESITFTSPTTAGIGTTFDCATKIGPLRLTDRMEITDWVPEQTMGVRHVGLVRGEGRFTLTPVGHEHTLFAWTENLTFVWWMGGGIGAFVGRPILRAVWRRNLRRLAARFDRR